MLRFVSVRVSHSLSESTVDDNTGWRLEMPSLLGTTYVTIFEYVLYSREVTLILGFQAKALPGKVAKILTWRWKPEPNVEGATDADAKKKNRHRHRQREMFVKWADMSYWHCEWVSELQVIESHFYSCLS